MARYGTHKELCSQLLLQALGLHTQCTATTYAVTWSTVPAEPLFKEFLQVPQPLWSSALHEKIRSQCNLLTNTTTHAEWAWAGANPSNQLVSKKLTVGYCPAAGRIAYNITARRVAGCWHICGHRG